MEKIQIRKTAGWYKEGEVYMVRLYQDGLYEVVSSENHNGKLITVKHCVVLK